MTFHVLPDPPGAPVTIAALQRGPAMTFAETVSGTTGSMTLRITRLGLYDGTPSAGPEPTFWISAGGAAQPVAALPATVSVLDHNDAVVATAGYAGEVFDVYRIDIVVQRPGSTWSLQIQNSDTHARSFTAVVADSDNGAHQPWINAAPTLALSGTSGSTQLVTGTVSVANYGTGPLSIQPGGLSDPFIAIAPEVIVPNGLAQLTIQCDPNKSGPRQQTLAIASNDTTASAAPAHNHAVAVSYGAAPTPPPPPPPPPPQLYGMCVHFRTDHCRMYVHPAGVAGPCQRPGCGHSADDHPA